MLKDLTLTTEAVVRCYIRINRSKFTDFQFSDFPIFRFWILDFWILGRRAPAPNLAFDLHFLYLISPISYGLLEIRLLSIDNM